MQVVIDNAMVCRICRLSGRTGMLNFDRCGATILVNKYLAISRMVIALQHGKNWRYLSAGEREKWVASPGVAHHVGCC
jgi:hypothetical protein